MSNNLLSNSGWSSESRDRNGKERGHERRKRGFRTFLSLISAAGPYLEKIESWRYCLSSHYRAKWSYVRKAKTPLLSWCWANGITRGVYHSLKQFIFSLGTSRGPPVYDSVEDGNLGDKTRSAQTLVGSGS